MSRRLFSFFIFAFLIFGVHPSALAASYSKLWERPLAGTQHPYALKSYPLVDENGNVYVATQDAVSSFDSAGNKRWEYAGNNFYPQLAVSAGKIFVLTNRYGLLTALNATTGAKIWEAAFNPNWSTSLFGGPAVLGDRVYVAYETQCPLATNEMKAFDVETGEMKARNDINTSTGAFAPNWGIISNDLAMPHLEGSKAQIFMTTFNSMLLSITRARLSASYDRGFTTRESPAPTLTSDDQNLILLNFGNELQYFKINADGEEAANPLFTVDLGGLSRTRAVEIGDLLLVNVGTPTELVAVSKTSKSVVWRRALNSSFATLPTLVADNLIVEAADKLTFLKLDTGEVVQEVELGGGGNYFTGAAVSNGQIYFINRDSRLVAYGPVVPKHHPVIFVHGLGGHAYDWEAGGNKEDYKIKLGAKYAADDPAFLPEWLLSYNYTGVDAKTGGYNNQGTIEEVSLGMEQAVATLSAQHKAAGGDGQVDLLGFSLGGLVIREYLATHSTSHNIHQAVTIASPHQGAYVADIRKIADAFGFNPVTKQYVISLMQSIGEVAQINVDPGKPVVEELYPDSDYVKNLRLINIDSPPIFDTIAGSISIKFKQRLFGRDFTFIPLDMGDLIMSEQSATTITPLIPNYIVPFSQDITVPLRFSRDGGFIGLDVSIPYLSAIRYRHLEISQQQDVVNKVTDLLSGDLI